MTIRHPKHEYLIKKQIFEEIWLITSNFFFREFQISRFFDEDFSCLDLFKYPECIELLNGPAARGSARLTGKILGLGL